MRYEEFLAPATCPAAPATCPATIRKRRLSSGKAESRQRCYFGVIGNSALRSVWQEHRNCPAVCRHLEHLSSRSGYSFPQLPHRRRTFAPQPGHFMMFATFRGCGRCAGCTCGAVDAVDFRNDLNNAVTIKPTSALPNMMRIPLSNILGDPCNTSLPKN